MLLTDSIYSKIEQIKRDCFIKLVEIYKDYCMNRYGGEFCIVIEEIQNCIQDKYKICFIEHSLNNDKQWIIEYHNENFMSDFINVLRKRFPDIKIYKKIKKIKIKYEEL